VQENGFTNSFLHKTLLLLLLRLLLLLVVDELCG